MFSGIYSLVFGKKNGHRNQSQTVDGSLADQSPLADQNNFVVIEKIDSNETDVNPELYPKIDSSDGYPPYRISPGLPNVRPAKSVPIKKEGTTVDFLHGVPFQLASSIDIMANEKADKFDKFLQQTQDILTEDKISEGYSYDFHLEQFVLDEFQTRA